MKAVYTKFPLMDMINMDLTMLRWCGTFRHKITALRFGAVPHLGGGIEVIFMLHERTFNIHLILEP